MPPLDSVFGRLRVDAICGKKLPSARAIHEFWDDGPCKYVGSGKKPTRFMAKSILISNRGWPFSVVQNANGHISGLSRVFTEVSHGHLAKQSGHPDDCGF